MIRPILLAVLLAASMSLSGVSGCWDTVTGCCREPPGPRLKFEGRVTSANGEPLYWASISPVGAYTDSTGWYSSAYYLCPVSYLEAGKTGYLPKRVDVRCRPGVEVDEQRVDFVLTPLPEPRTLRFAGRVTGNDGEPVEGAGVYACETVPAGCRMMGKAWTDSVGFYDIAFEFRCDDGHEIPVDLHAQKLGRGASDTYRARCVKAVQAADFVLP